MKSFIIKVTKILKNIQFLKKTKFKHSIKVWFGSWTQFIFIFN